LATEEVHKEFEDDDYDEKRITFHTHMVTLVTISQNVGGPLAPFRFIMWSLVKINSQPLLYVEEVKVRNLSLKRNILQANLKAMLRIVSRNICSIFIPKIQRESELLINVLT